MPNKKIIIFPALVFSLLAVFSFVQVIKVAQAAPNFSAGMTISSGNVGIGTEAPLSKLYVSGGSNSTDRPLILKSSAYYEVGEFIGPGYPSLLLTNSGGSTSFISNYNSLGLALSANTSTWSTADLFIKNGGNVGIGTTGPNYKLDIANGDINLGTTGNKIYFSSDKYLYEGAGEALTYRLHTAQSDPSFILEDQNGTARVKFSLTGNSWLNGGKVGISTANPLDLLSIGIQPTTGSTIGTGHNSSSGYITADTYALANIGYVQSYFTSVNHKPVSLNVIGSAPNANGATITADQVLNLEPANASFGGVVTTGTQTLAGAKTFTGTATFNNATYSALFTGGNVGIGTNNPTNKLTVYGSIAKETTTGYDGTFDNLIKYGHKNDIEGSGQSLDRWIGIDASITAGAAATNKMKFKVYNGGASGAPADIMTLQGDGLVGVGIASPSTLLHISKTASSNTEALLTITNNYASNWARAVDILIPNQPTGGWVTPFLAGVNHSANNQFDIGFYYAASGSTNNKMGLGFYNNDNLLVLQANGYVGIGTTNPLDKLSIGVQPTTGSAIGTGHNSTNTYITTDTYALANIGYVKSSVDIIVPGGPSALWSGIKDNNIWNGTAGAGNVGIGTTGPSAYFHGGTNKVLEIQNSATAANSQAQLILSTGATANLGGVGTLTWIASNASTNKGIAYIAGLVTADSSVRGVGAIAFATADSAVPAERMRITNKGNVGIGTVGPNDNFSIGGAAGAAAGAGSDKTGHNFTMGYLTADDYSLVNTGYFKSANNDLWSGTRNSTIWNGDSGAGNVGIGTVSPVAKLHVSTSASGNTLLLYSNNTLPWGPAVLQNISSSNTNNSTETAIGLNLENSSQTVNTYSPLISFSRHSTSGSYNGVYGYIGGYATGDSWATEDVAGDLVFGTGSSVTNGPLERLRIISTGNVGIGTPSPTSLLYVNGTMTVAGISTFTGSARFNGGIAMGAVPSDIDLNWNDIKNVDKITANVVDPLYNIKGTNYSTYAAAIAGGLKEEYIGRVSASDFSKKNGYYETTIDLAKEKEGSDLWVWYHVVEFNDQNVEIFLTPRNSFASVYSLISGSKIIIRSDHPADMSMRLVGSRFDWRKWPTKPLDQTEKSTLIIK